jgi:hypothetical protein
MLAHVNDTTNVHFALPCREDRRATSNKRESSTRSSPCPAVSHPSGRRSQQPDSFAFTARVGLFFLPARFLIGLLYLYLTCFAFTLAVLAPRQIDQSRGFVRQFFSHSHCEASFSTGCTTSSTEYCVVGESALHSPSDRFGVTTSADRPIFQHHHTTTTPEHLSRYLRGFARPPSCTYIRRAPHRVFLVGPSTHISRSSAQGASPSHRSPTTTTTTTSTTFVNVLGRRAIVSDWWVCNDRRGPGSEVNGDAADLHPQ